MIAFSSEFEHLDGTPFVFARRGTRTVLDPALTRDILSEPIDITNELRSIRLSTAVRERASSVEWRASTRLTVTSTELGPRGDGWETSASPSTASRGSIRSSPPEGDPSRPVTGSGEPD